MVHRIDLCKCILYEMIIKVYTMRWYIWNISSVKVTLCLNLLDMFKITGLNILRKLFVSFREYLSAVSYILEIFNTISKNIKCWVKAYVSILLGTLYQCGCHKSIITLCSIWGLYIGYFNISNIMLGYSQHILLQPSYIPFTDGNQLRLKHEYIITSIALCGTWLLNHALTLMVAYLLVFPEPQPRPRLLKQCLLT